MDSVQARPCAIVLLSPHWVIVCDVYIGEMFLKQLEEALVCLAPFLVTELLD